MVVSNVVEELLGVERSAEQESEVAIRRFDDVGNLVHGVPSVEGVGVDETILDSFVDDDASLERLGDSGEERWVDDWRSSRNDGATRRARAREGSTTGRGVVRVHVGPLARGEGEGSILAVRRFGLRREHAHGFGGAARVDGGVGRGGRAVAVG